MSQLVDQLTPGALPLCNESFASTNEQEGSEIARQLVTALTGTGVTVHYVTHLYDLADSLHRRRLDSALFLRAQRLPDGTRTFRIVPGAPQPASHGEDSYRRAGGDRRRQVVTDMVTMRARQPAVELSQLDLVEVAGWLEQPGRPVCGQETEAVDRFFTWFAVEHYNQLETLTKLRNAAGMCPAHTRAMLAQPGAAGRGVIVYGHVLPAARGRLTEYPVAACPVCQARDTSALRAGNRLLAALAEPGLRGSYPDSGGMCARHLRQARPAGPEQTRMLVRPGLDRFTSGVPSLLEMAGPDPDAEARARLRATLPTVPGWEASTTDARAESVARVRALLEVDACPGCLVAALAERGYLAWLCAEHASGGPEPAEHASGGPEPAEHASGGPESLASQPGGLCPQSEPGRR